METINKNIYERWTEYDDKGNLIHSKDSNGYEYERSNDYDNNGNLIHFKQVKCF